MDFIKWTGWGLTIGRLELPIPILVLWVAWLLILITGYAPVPKGRGPMIRRRDQPIHYWLVFFIITVCFAGFTAMFNLEWLTR